MNKTRKTAVIQLILFSFAIMLSLVSASPLNVTMQNSLFSSAYADYNTWDDWDDWEDWEEDEETNPIIQNKLILRFVNEYDAVATYPLQNVEKGNIRTKYHAHANDCWIEIIDATGAPANYFSVSIHGGNDKEKNAKMFDIFPVMLSVLDPTLSEMDINEAIRQMMLPGGAGTRKIGRNIEIYYSASTELSWGTTDARIDIHCFSYR